MIDLHYWPTPNGWKISIMLEECGLPYRLLPVNIGKGEQFTPEFLAISPNNRMPAIVDHAPAGGGAPVAVFESGAILLYLAEKTGRFLPTELRERYQALQWLMWQMGGLGPMAGTERPLSFVRARQNPLRHRALWQREVDRSLRRARRAVGAHRRVCGRCQLLHCRHGHLPWVRTHKAQQVELQRFPHVQRWYDALFERPAVRRGLDLGKQLRAPALTEEARKALFGQTAQSVREGAHKVS